MVTNSRIPLPALPLDRAGAVGGPLNAERKPLLAADRGSAAVPWFGGGAYHLGSDKFAKGRVKL